MLFVKLVKQFLSFGVREQLGHIVFNQFGNMRGNNRCGINHGIAAEHCLFPIGLVNPHGPQTESRLGGIFAGQRNRLAARIHHQQLGRAQFALAGPDFLDVNVILIRLKLHIILNTD